jgi:hypothetical protein
VCIRQQQSADAIVLWMALPLGCNESCTQMSVPCSEFELSVRWGYYHTPLKLADILM